MASLHAELTTIPTTLEIAECARCGVEIEFSTPEEFEKLANEHIHLYR